MTRKQNIAWKDVLDLRVVRHLRRLVERRWRLGLRFVSAEGSWVDIDAACAETAPRELAQGLAKALRKHHPEQRSVVVSGHAGQREVAAPIVVDGEFQGLVIAGGQPFGVALEAAASPVPLTGTDEEYLRDLLELLVDELVGFQAEVAGNDRRLVVDRPTRYCYDNIIGQSRPLKELYHLLDKVIDSDSTVLIQGENGTGKELIAKAIHFNSWRKDRRFVVQNCSAFNDNLLDSELFGHKKGSFTGAISDKQGLFEVADGSTFFLDEIGDMSPSLQVKLLRVLQEGTFIPVGDTQSKTVDVRIIAATNRDLKRMVERGEFREDLYYRINVINIHVPSLRERREDILPLVDHFLLKQARDDRSRLKKLSKACLAAFLEYSWPGNIRELENEIERLVVLAGDEKLITEDLLSSRIRSPASSHEVNDELQPNCLPDAVQDLERKMIYEVLKRNHWNKTRAAQELHISRRNLIRKVNKYNLDQRRASREGD
jgi:transcriptional regulator with PAS, ATPase and Fis domain